jgi:hypothetical protein
MKETIILIVNAVSFTTCIVVLYFSIELRKKRRKLEKEHEALMQYVRDSIEALKKKINE